MDGNPAEDVARVNPDGGIDGSFRSPFCMAADYFEGVFAIGLQADGKVLLAGDLPDTNCVLNRHLLVRLNADGSWDNTLALPADLTNSFDHSQRLNALLIQPDQKIIIAGDFPGVSNRFRNGLARLMPDGSIDSSFSAGPPDLPPIYGSIQALALQPDGKILVGGNFVQFDGTPRNALVRLNADGSLDQGFKPNGPSGGGVGYWLRVNTLALQTDGKIIAGGTFFGADESWHTGVGRFGGDGSADAMFDSNGVSDLLEYVSQVAVLADGHILVAGTPAWDEGIEGGGLFRLNGGEFLMFQSLRARADGSIELNLTTPRAGTYILETSPDLLRWNNISTNTLPSGASRLIDSSAAATGQRFYRITVHQ